MAVNRQNAYIGQQLELGIRFRYDRSGELFDPYSFDKVEIIDSDSELVLETIHSSNITRVSVGTYKIVTQQHSTWNTVPRTIIDKWYFKPDGASFVVTLAESTLIRSETSSQSNFPTPSDIRNRFLRGIKLYDEFGESMSDEDIQFFIDSAVDTLERKLGIDINPRVVKSRPLEDGEYADIEEPAYPYEINDYMNWGYMKLFRKPVQKIDKMEWIYPTGQNILTIPEEWIKLVPRHGMLNIIPTAGTLSQVIVAQGGQFLPMLSAGYIGNLPHMIHVDYTTGFKDGEIPNDMFLAIGKMTSNEILQIMSDAIAQGLVNTSITADGLSLSLSKANSQTAQLFQARMDNYNKWLDKYYEEARNFFFGIGLTII